MVSLIVAMTKEGVIGKGNDLPWPFTALKEDRKNFKELTTGNIVVMGRKTYESLPPKYRPLPNRTNIVVSKTVSQIDGAVVIPKLEDVLYVTPFRLVFIIGGASIYKEALEKDFLQRMHVSWVKEPYQGDIYFPRVDWQQWKEIERKPFEEFDYVTYERVTLPLARTSRSQ